MTHLYLSLRNSSISYYRFGSGERVVIAIHGYSNDAQMFDLLEEDLKNNFTFICIDLPLHGHTRWNKDLLTPKKLQDIIDQILNKENLPKTYWLLGFSLGGRVALSIYQFAPNKVKRLILLAPDGLYTNWWNKFWVQTYIGNRTIAFFLKRPKSAMKLLNWYKKNHLINHKIYCFAQGLLSSKREGKLLYKRWKLMLKMRPSLHKIGNLITQYQTPVSLVFGKADGITPSGDAQYFAEKTKPYVAYSKWNAGHLLLRQKYLPQLISLFK